MKIFIWFIVIVFAHPLVNAKTSSALMCQLSFHTLDSKKAYESWERLVFELSTDNGILAFRELNYHIDLSPRPFWAEIYGRVDSFFWESFGEHIFPVVNDVNFFAMQRVHFKLGLLYPKADYIGLHRQNFDEVFDYLFEGGLTYETSLALLKGHKKKILAPLVNETTKLAKEYLVALLNALSKKEQIALLGPRYFYFHNHLLWTDHGKPLEAEALYELRLWEFIFEKIDITAEELVNNQKVQPSGGMLAL